MGGAQRRQSSRAWALQRTTQSAAKPMQRGQ